MAESALLLFYRGLGPDHAGRHFDDIVAWDHHRLEMVHDYIQWLFPLPDPSRFNPDAPILTAADVMVFQTDPKLHAQVHRALDLMLDFWGFARAGHIIQRSRHFSQNATRWLQPLNHNYLRLTRALLFLRSVGFADEAASLRACLMDIAMHEGRDVISPRTLSFWKDASGTHG